MVRLQGENTYSKISRQRRLWILVMSISLITLFFLSITWGVAKISLKEALSIVGRAIIGQPGNHSSYKVGVVMNLRLPRILLAILAGSALGASGVLMQSVLHNPLASPYTLGVSAGSSFGAAITIVLGQYIFGARIMLTPWPIVLGAFIFGLLTIVLLNIIASISGNSGVSILVLAGVALGYLFSSGVSFVKYITNQEELKELTLWLMGGLYRANWSTIMILMPLVIIGLLFLLRFAWDLNALVVGEEVATNLGVDVVKLRRRGSVIAALLTSCVVAFTGIIGFIGLVAPHASRRLVGNDSRYLIVGSSLMGALLLLIADTLARLIINPVELPVGILTSLIGAPFFLFLLLKKRKGCWQ